MTPAHDDAAAADAPLELIFTAGHPSPAEVAAVTAVATAALEELADEAAEASPAPSAWQRSQRPIRGELRPGPGAWRGFSG